MPANSTLTGGSTAAKRRGAAGESVRIVSSDLRAIPYYAWAHRGRGEMAVWLPVDPALAHAPPARTIASTSKPGASHVLSSDTVAALNDQREPIRL